MRAGITKLSVRQHIFNQTEPFCLTDICNRIDKIEPTDHNLILSVLDEMYEEGLVSFEHLPEKKGNTEWAFVVDNDMMNTGIKK